MLSRTLQEHDVLTLQLASGVPLEHHADHLHHLRREMQEAQEFDLVIQLLLEHSHEVLPDVLACLVDPIHFHSDLILLATALV